MKSRDGRSQRREEKEKEDQKRESLRRKKIQVCEKVGKSRNTVFFRWFVAPEGRKVGSLKRRVRSHGPDERWKIARGCGAKHISKSKCTPSAFRRSDVVSRGRCQGLRTLSKVSKTWGFCSISKDDSRRGTFEEDLHRCISRGRCSTRHMFIRPVRRSGRRFPERGCSLEHQIFSFAEMILRDRCSNSFDLASLFRGRRSTLDRWRGKIAKRIGTRPSALHLTFHFEKEVSQNSFVFDVVSFKNWRSLAEFLRFWCCQVWKMKKSRRIVSFLTLSNSKIEEVSQTYFVFDVVNFEKRRSLAELLRFSSLQIDRQTDRQTGTQTDRTDRQIDR